jgi:hypothetical protein
MVLTSVCKQRRHSRGLPVLVTPAYIDVTGYKNSGWSVHISVQRSPYSATLGAIAMRCIRRHVLFAGRTGLTQQTFQCIVRDRLLPFSPS